MTGLFLPFHSHSPISNCVTAVTAVASFELVLVQSRCVFQVWKRFVEAIFPKEEETNNGTFSLKITILVYNQRNEGNTDQTISKTSYLTS